MTSRQLRQSLLAAALCVGLSAPAAAYDMVPGYEETLLRTSLKDDVSQAFGNGDFETVEQLVEAYRASEEKTPSGLDKLAIAWDGIENALQAIYGNTTGDPLMELVDGYEKAYPRSPTPHIARAKLLTFRAWAERLGQPINEVPPEAWTKFYSGIAQATAVLLEHREIAERDPEYYSMLISLNGAAQGYSADLIRLAEEASQHFPDYLDLHQDLVFFLQPGSGGSMDAIETYARAMVEVTRATDAESMYARIYWMAIRQIPVEWFHMLELDWPTMKRAMHDVIARYPDRWNANSFALFSCYAGDRDETRAMLDLVKGEPDSNAWYGQHYYNLCREWAYGQPQLAGSSPIKEIMGKLKSMPAETN